VAKNNVLALSVTVDQLAAASWFLALAKRSIKLYSQLIF